MAIGSRQVSSSQTFWSQTLYSKKILKIPEVFLFCSLNTLTFFVLEIITEKNLKI